MRADWEMGSFPPHVRFASARVPRNRCPRSPGSLSSPSFGRTVSRVCPVDMGAKCRGPWARMARREGGARRVVDGGWPPPNTGREPAGCWRRWRWLADANPFTPRRAGRGLGPARRVTAVCVRRSRFGYHSPAPPRGLLPTGPLVRGPQVPRRVRDVRDRDRCFPVHHLLQKAYSPGLSSPCYCPRVSGRGIGEKSGTRIEDLRKERVNYE